MRGMKPEAILAGINAPLSLSMQAIANGPNPHYHPDDDQLIREFMACVETGSGDWIFASQVPRSQIEAVIRRIRSAF